MNKFNMANTQSQQQQQGNEQSNIVNSFKEYFEELNVQKLQLIKEFEKFQKQFDYQSNLKQLNTQEINQEQFKLLIEDFNQISKLVRCLKIYNMEKKTLQLLNDQNQQQNQPRSNKNENEFNSSKNQYEENKNNSENKNYQNFSNSSQDQRQFTSSIKKSETTKNQPLTNNQDSSIHDAVQQNKQSNTNYNPYNYNDQTKYQNGWNQNSYNTSNLNQQQQQQQLQIPQQKQIEQQIQYYVYEDLNNFMGVLTDVQETIEFFKNQPNHPYIPIAINRLVNQTNISNGVHFSCYQECKDSEQAKIYLREKQVALQMFKDFLKKMNLTTKQTKLKECLDQFEKNFNNTVCLNPIKDVQTETKGDFNQQVVDKIVSGIQNQENTQHLIYEGKYKKLEKTDIEQNIKQRKERAQELLKANFQKK